MKPVLVNAPATPYITFESLRMAESGILGIQFGKSDKAWLQPLGYYANGGYKLFSVDGGVHHGNVYNQYKSIRDFLEYFRNDADNGKTKVFMFDTEKELFKWLSE